MINLRLDKQTARFLLQLLEEHQNVLAVSLLVIRRTSLDDEPTI